MYRMAFRRLSVCIRSAAIVDRGPTGAHAGGCARATRRRRGCNLGFACLGCLMRWPRAAPASETFAVPPGEGLGPGLCFAIRLQAVSPLVWPEMHPVFRALRVVARWSGGIGRLTGGSARAMGLTSAALQPRRFLIRRFTGGPFP